MTKRRWPWLLLAGLWWCAAAGTTFAQPFVAPEGDGSKRSHRPIAGPDDLNQAQDQFANRLRRIHDRQALDDLVRTILEDKELVKKLASDERLKNIKPGDLPPEDMIRELKDKIARDPKLADNETLRNLMNKAEKGDKPSDKETADFKKLLEDKFPKGLGKLPDPKNTTHPDDSNHPGANPGDSHNGPPGGMPPFPPGMQPPPPPPPENKSSWIPRGWIDGAADAFKDMAPSPDNEAIRTALKELARADGSDSWLTAWNSSPKEGALAGDGGWFGQNAKMPSLPSFGGWSTPSLPSTPPVGAGPDVSGAGAADVVVWILALALIGVAAWLVLSWARKQATAGRADGWSPGPWPVDPSAVSTREDLIRAFEYLAFLLLGPVARTLNHLDAAARMREKSGRAGEPARLARLYECARYAPPEDPLPADEVAAARGDLRALAGATS